MLVEGCHVAIVRMSVIGHNTAEVTLILVAQLLFDSSKQFFLFGNEALNLLVRTRSHATTMWYRCARHVSEQLALDCCRIVWKCYRGYACYMGVVRERKTRWATGSELVMSS